MPAFTVKVQLLKKSTIEYYVIPFILISIGLFFGIALSKY